MEYLMQPIGRSALLEEVGESLVPAPVPANVGMVVEQEVAEQQRPVGSADAQIMVAKEAAADRRESSPPASELSMGKMNPGVRMEQEDEDSCCSTEQNPWPKSHQCIEKAVRCYADNPGENVITPVLGTSFDSFGEAYDFYNLHSREKGFDIRYGKSRLNVERAKCMQE